MSDRPIGPRDFWVLYEDTARRFKALAHLLKPRSQAAALSGVNVAADAWLDACERELRRRKPHLFP